MKGGCSFCGIPAKGGCSLKKDLYLKRYLSDKRRFADIINGFVAEGRELISVADLTDLGSQSESTRTQKYRDRLYRAAFGVTLVLYFGGQWDGAKSLHELLDFTDIPKELQRMVNDYQVHILEVQKLEDTSVFRTDVKQVFDAVRLSKAPEKFRELIFSDPAFSDLDIEAYNVIVQYTHSKDLLDLKENYKKGAKINMCQALTMMLEEERNVGKNVGLREGKTVGLREGKAESILDILSEYSIIPKGLSDRILSENDLSVLTNWLKLAAKSATLDEFTKNM